MNKAEFVASMAESAGMTKADAERAFSAFRSTLESALPDSGKIALAGIGTFTVQERPARKGRNPATGEEIAIPAKQAIRFKPAKELVDRLNP
jgi:DNA-binding protein HU-beta